MSKCTTRSDGTKEWRKDHFRHRIDGPAVEYPNGHVEWWVYGKYYVPEKAILNADLHQKYPELINAMIVYLVHAT